MTKFCRTTKRRHHIDSTTAGMSKKVVNIKQINHTSLVAEVTQNGIPKSARNRCIIDLFGGVIVLTILFYLLV